MAFVRLFPIFRGGDKEHFGGRSPKAPATVCLVVVVVVLVDGRGGG